MHILLRTLVISILGLQFALAIDLDQEPILYWESANDRVSRLQAKIEAGEAHLGGSSRKEILEKLLIHLEIPVESQVLVFSKTSAQNSRISPERPRAIYFSDDCYVGWVQGGSIEVMTFDPQRGAVFYLIDLNPQPDNRGYALDFTRPKSCLNCHERSSYGGATAGLVRSVFPSSSGLPIFHAGTHYIDDESEIDIRWGGWYVTGRSGNQTHMGNSLAVESDDSVMLHPIAKSGLELDSLEGVINTSGYPGGDLSDILALMVLEHQVAMHNILVKANLTIRQLAHRTAGTRRSLGEPVPVKPEGTLKRVIESQAEKIVGKLLFRDEHLMEDDGIDGGEGFRRAFLANNRSTKSGRGLKDLRLYERLFKNRCSYVIYSEVFDHLTPHLKAEVYRQLLLALTEPTSHLSETEQERIREILLETKPEFVAFSRQPQ